MGVPRVNKCCLCIDLKFASYFIGYFSMLSALVTLFYILTKHSNDATDAVYQLQGNTQKTISATMIAGVVLYFAISLLLVIGLHKNFSFLLPIFYFVMSVMIISSLLTVVIALCMLYLKAAVVLLMSCVLNGYFTIVVRSCYLEIQEKKNAPMQINKNSSDRAPIV